MLLRHAADQPSPTLLRAGSPEDKRDAKRQRSPEIQPLSPEPPPQNRKPASSSLQPARSHRSLPSVLEHSPLGQLARPERSAASLHPLLQQGTPQDDELAVEPSQGGRQTLAAAQAEGCSVEVSLDRSDEVGSPSVVQQLVYWAGFAHQDSGEQCWHSCGRCSRSGRADERRVKGAQ